MMSLGTLQRAAALEPNLRCAFGDADHHNESFADTEHDPRWHTERRRVLEGAAVRAELQLRWPTRAGRATGLLGRNVADLVSRAGLEPPADVVVAGATARYKGGGLAVRRGSQWDCVDHLAELVGRAAETARERGAVLVAPQVPAPQLGAFLTALPHGTTVLPGHDWSSIDTAGLADEEAYLARHASPVRNTWRKDEEVWQRSGLELEIRPWDEALIEEAAPLVADVSTRNGTPEDPRLVPWRLTAWRENTTGRHLMLVARDAGQLVGVCFAREAIHALDAYDIGLAPDHPHRHAIYTELVVRTPVRLALRSGKDRVDLGVGHPAPKQRRGADSTLQWSLVHVPA